MPDTNPLLKHLGLTTDAELLALFTDLSLSIKNSQKEADKIDADYFLDQLCTAWKQRLQEKKISFEAFQDMLGVINKLQTPEMSTRLIQTGKLPNLLDARFGDSFLLPNGLFQLLHVKVHFFGKERLRLIEIISAKALKKAALLNLIPEQGAPEHNIEFEHERFDQINILNHLIAKKKKGMWVGRDAGFAGFCYTSNYTALNVAITELLAKRKNTGFWQPPPALLSAQPKPLPQYHLPIKIAKAPQRNNKRSLEEITTTMQTILQQLNSQTSPTHPQVYQHRRADDNETIEIYQTLVAETTLVIAATANTVTLYQPLIRDKTLSYADKAALCLKALGIPPLNGRETIEIEGASPPFHDAIMKHFNDLIASEHKKPLNRSINH